jgi:hypothetical protein
MREDHQDLQGTHLQLRGSRHLRDAVNDVPHNLGCFGFRDVGEKAPQLGKELCQGFSFLPMHQHLAQLCDGLLFALQHVCVA